MPGQQANEGSEILIEVRISARPISDAERLARLRSLGRRLEQARREQQQASLRGNRPELERM